MRIKSYIPVILLSLSALFSGCAALTPAFDKADRPAACNRFIDELADTIAETGVRDAGAPAVPEFPYLRTSRFLCALAENLDNDDRFSDWLGLMKQQASLSFEKEIQNLPTPVVEKLANDFAISPNRAALLEMALACGVALSAHDETLSDFRKVLLSSAHPPSEYSSVMRIFGLYPLASLPVAYLTHKAQNSFTDWFEIPLESLPAQGRLIVYGPEKNGGSSQKNVRDIVQTAAENTLHMKLFDSDHVRKLAEALAPTLVQDDAGPRDIPGEVAWLDGQVRIDTSVPTVYYYLSYGIVKKKPIVQMNYVAWFSAREGTLAPWIERGPLDGLTLRISLNHEGEPFMLDIMNSCGCYHMFIPRKETIIEIKEKAMAIDAFIPQWLPDDFPAFPLRVRVNSGWHQVQRVWASNEPLLPTSTYRLIPYDILETLPHSDRHTESVFNDRGIMKGSNRIEPLLLFSMGVPSVGSMRQRGHHAISLVGREHFDAPDLFEKNFVFK